jgi:hypothetical protein
VREQRYKKIARGSEVMREENRREIGKEKYILTRFEKKKKSLKAMHVIEGILFGTSGIE